MTKDPSLYLFSYFSVVGGGGVQSVYFHYSIVIIYRQAQANTLFPVKAIIEGHWSAKVMRDGSDVRGSRKHQSEDRQVVDWTSKQRV